MEFLSVLPNRSSEIAAKIFLVTFLCLMEFLLYVKLTNRRSAIFREAARFPNGVEEFQEILWTFWDIEVWPVEVVELLHLPLLPGSSVGENEAPDMTWVNILLPSPLWM